MVGQSGSCAMASQRADGSKIKMAPEQSARQAIVKCQAVTKIHSVRNERVFQVGTRPEAISLPGHR
jgi:hypothetical protein